MFLWSILALILTICLAAAFLLILRPKLDKGDFYKILGGLIGVLISIGLGCSAYFLQQSIVENRERKSIQEALEEELNSILEILSDTQESCTNGDETIGINVNLLPSGSIQFAIDSHLFSRVRIRDMIRLKSMINEHNRMAEFGMEAIGGDPTNLQKRLNFLSQNAKTDGQIKIKAKYLNDCIGSKKSNLADCHE